MPAQAFSQKYAGRGGGTPIHYCFNLSTELGIASHLVVAAMHDRAAVNEVAVRTVSILFDRLMDVGCFSHTLDHVGEKMKTPISK